MEEKETVLEETKEEVKVETSEKKSGGNKVLIIIIVILLLIIAIGFGYFLGNGSSNSDNKENDKVVEENKDKEETKDETKEENTPPVLTKESKVVIDLFNIFKVEDCDEYSFIKKVNTDVGVKKYFIYRSLTENEFVNKTCGSLNANRYGDGLFCAESAYYGENWTKYDNDVKNKNVRTFDAKLFKEKYLKLYGANVSYTDGNFDLLRGPIAYYDSTNNLYAIFNCWCGGACGTSYEHVIVDILQDGYNLTISTELTTYSGDNIESVEKVQYLFEYESSTGNYIFVKAI